MSLSKLLLDIPKTSLGRDSGNKDDEIKSQNKGDFIKACEEILDQYDQNQNIAAKEDLKKITPTPGFCLKTSTETGEKVFINICHCGELPFNDITEKELTDLLTSEETSSYRVPMSIGELHMEKDKGGKRCKVYDVAISSQFYSKVDNIELFKHFVISIVLEGVEEKYNCKLNRENCIVLKNKNLFGVIQEQYIRSLPRPLVTELDAPVKQVKNKSAEKSPLPEPPNYVLWKEPPESDLPNKILGEFHLKETKLKDVILELGEDRLVLEHVSSKFSPVDIYLPYLINPDKSQADFSNNTGILKIVLSVTS